MTARKRNFWIFLVCYLAYATIYIARLNISVASPEILSQQILTSEQYGVIGGAFFVVYAISRVVNGWVCDKAPPWIMLSIGLALAGISNVLLSYLPPFIAFLLLWCCNAFAQSMLWGAIIRVISERYTPEKAKKMTSYMISSTAAGNILSILLTSAIIERFGLRFAFLLPGLLLIILCAAVILTVRDVPCAVITQNHLPLHKVITDVRMGPIIIPTFVHGLIKDNICLWMTVYFVDRYGIDLQSSAWFVLLIPIIGFLGRLVYPVFLKLYKQQDKKLFTHMFALCILASVLLVTNKLTPMLALLCLAVIYGAISIINTILVAVPLQFAANGNQASVGGMIDFFTYLGAGIGSCIFGYLISLFGYAALYTTFAVLSAISIIIMKQRGVKRDQRHDGAQIGKAN